MTKLLSQQILDYLDALEQALRLPSAQKRAICEEVRADLRAHIEAHVANGCDESQAVELALAELGPVDELATQMSEATPPMCGPTERWIRYACATLLTVTFLWVCWHIRAMTVGISLPRVLGIVAGFTPLLLLIWPEVIWRKNWMFSVLPTVLIFGTALVLLSVGQEQSAEVTVPINGEPTTSPSLALSDSAELAMTKGFALGLFTLLTVYLLAMMQRRRQRLAAMCVMGAVLLLVEAPYAVEEYFYARDLDETRLTLEAYKRQHRAYPSSEQFQETVAPCWFYYTPRDGGAHYMLFWDRPMNPGYALCFSSDGNRFWIND